MWNKFHVGRMCCPFVDSGYGFMGCIVMVKDLLNNAANYDVIGSLHLSNQISSSMLSASWHGIYMDLFVLKLSVCYSLKTGLFCF